MNIVEMIKIFGIGTVLVILIFYAAVWLLKKSIEKLLEKELALQKNDLAKELESHKRTLDLEYKHKLSLQERRRKLYEEFSISLEDMFKEEFIDLDIGSKKYDTALMLNKLFGLLALYAPDDVYLSLKKSLEGKVVPNEVKPIIYSALRKSLFGDETVLNEEDLVKHINVNTVNK